jgi:Meiotically Up-regulated Gene 113 (MUG113) protein/DnaT-like ssDNA binding protein
VSGRIRSIKPEWLEDEALCSLGPEARVLSVALILLADDYGRGRANTKMLGARVFPSRPSLINAAMSDLQGVGYFRVYEVRSQNYFQIKNWSKHQRVDKPGKSDIPAPQDEEGQTAQTDNDFTYFIVDRTNNRIKIGRSWSPKTRLKRLQESTGAALELIGQVDGGWREKDLHRRFADQRIGNREWFAITGDLLDFIRDEFAYETRTVREPSANGRGRNATDLEGDLNLEVDQEGDEDSTRVATPRWSNKPDVLAEDWIPPDDLLDVLVEKHDAKPEQIRRVVPEFRRYWRTGKGAGKRRGPRGWEQAFTHRVAQLAKSEELYAGPRGSAAGEGQESIRWAE